MPGQRGRPQHPGPSRAVAAAAAAAGGGWRPASAILRWLQVKERAKGAGVRRPGVPRGVEGAEVGRLGGVF